MQLINNSKNRKSQIQFNNKIFNKMAIKKLRIKYFKVNNQNFNTYIKMFF